MAGAWIKWPALSLLAIAACSGSCSDDDTGASTSAANGSGGAGGLTLTGGSAGGLPLTCADAEAQKSYIGCEYWPTITSNARLYPGFSFAVAVTNPTDTNASVSVTRGGATLANVSVAAGAVETIVLPWVQELKQVEMSGNGSELASALVKGGAYRLVSTTPVVVYQFNPLEFELVPEPPSCPNSQLFGGCFSFSNDASLLLPTSALRAEHLVLSYPTAHLGYENLVFMTTAWHSRPGFVAVTAVEDGTSVTVRVAGRVRAGAGVTALMAGEQASYTLDAGDVLQLASDVMPEAETPQPNQPCVVETNGNYDVHKCPSSPEFDLTGSHIDADKPLSVIAGHDCTFVPYDVFACDHLEESQLPVEALGNDMLVTAPSAADGMGTAAMLVRVLSAADGNTVTFDPPVSAPVTLDTGAWVELGPLTEDVRVLADGKVAVAQYMVGANYGGMSTPVGDPSMSLAIPSAQYRTRYAFLAPATYTQSFVNVIAKAGAVVRLDDQPIAGFVAIGASGMTVARQPVSGGSHRIDGDSEIGIVVYGYGAYTSYMYPGGLDLETITIPAK